VYRCIVGEAKNASLVDSYHVYACRATYDAHNVRFYQIPNRILIDFGFDEAEDSFGHSESDSDV
jgi:adenine-specific DNA-methyltransferase